MKNHWGAWFLYIPTALRLQSQQLTQVPGCLYSCDVVGEQEINKGSCWKPEWSGKVVCREDAIWSAVLRGASVWVWGSWLSDHFTATGGTLKVIPYNEWSKCSSQITGIGLGRQQIFVVFRNWGCHTGQRTRTSASGKLRVGDSVPGVHSHTTWGRLQSLWEPQPAPL